MRVILLSDISSNLEVKKSLKSHGTGSVPYINKGRAQEMPNLINENCESQVTLKSKKVDDIANECGLKVQIPIKVNATVVNPLLLRTEFELLDCIYKLRSSLRIDFICFEEALKSLDHISTLKITVHMLIKNKDVMDTIRKVSKYGGNPSELGLSKDGMDDYLKKSLLIRHKSEKILNTFLSLFTIANGHLLQD